LREGVTGVLKEIHRHGGDAAFHRAARDLVASVAAIVAQVEAGNARSTCSVSSTARPKPERRATPPQML
jgi:hypothetical protein